LSSDAPPPSGKKPELAPISIGGGWTLVYAILALAFFGAGGWMVYARKAELTDPAVLVSVVGGFWFIARVFMTMKKP